MQEKIKSRVNNYINTSILISAVFLVLGLILLIFPTGALNLIRWILAVFFLISGAYSLASNFSKTSFFPVFGGVITGVISMVLGLILIIYPSVMNLFPILIGTWFIISGVLSLTMSSTIKRNQSASLFIALLSLICGILLITNPIGSMIGLTVFVGVIIIIYAAINLIDMVILRRNLKELLAGIKSYTKNSKSGSRLEGVSEAEIVEKKSSKSTKNTK